MEASFIATRVKNQLDVPDGEESRGLRRWSVAELSGPTWFLAENRSADGTIQRHIAPKVRQLAPLLGRNSTGSWRCFAYMADPCTSEGFTFQEVLEVLEVSSTNLMLIRFKSGLFGVEPGDASPNLIGSRHSSPPPLLVGTHVFRWWPSSERGR